MRACLKRPARRLSPLCLLALMATGVQAQSAPAEPLRLRPGDAVRLQVADEPTLAGQYPVTEEGFALLPLIGLVRVAGRPFEEVRADVVGGLHRKGVDAAVLVSPLLRIAVLGEVRQPGLIPVDPTFTVADVLAAAGGITPQGNPDAITLSGSGGELRFSLSDDPEVMARPLRPGEQIVVDRVGWARQNLGVLLGAGASVLAAAVTSLIIR